MPVRGKGVGVLNGKRDTDLVRETRPIRGRGESIREKAVQFRIFWDPRMG